MVGHQDELFRISAGMWKEKWENWNHPIKLMDGFTAAIIEGAMLTVLMHTNLSITGRTKHLFNPYTRFGRRKVSPVPDGKQGWS